ncbi:MAG: isopenicillin N synthase family oxygenase [Bdellovibrionales bacterium]|nr:isopenicillin N synthase family oxygenase [Bdellovibrionales bacterium]
MKVAKVSYKAKDAGRQFAESLRNTGFAVIVDHPIPFSLIEETFKDWADFFKSEDKFKYKFDPATQEGYFPFRTENAKDSKVKDLKEFYHLFNATTVPQGMSPRTRELYDRMHRIATELLGWLETETPDAIKKTFSMPLPSMIEGSKDTLLRPIHYPPLSGSEEEGAIRAAAHEDINLITVLPASTAPGLQVRDTHGNWHDVSCDPGALAINAGDMLQMITKGYYISTTHRVVNPLGPEAKKARYSMPLFLHPRPDVPLSEEHTAGSYLKERLVEIGLLKKGEQTVAKSGSKT